MSYTRTTTLDMLYTNTWWERRKKVHDVIFQKVACLYLMTKKNNMIAQSGGSMIECPVEYDTNPTVKAIGRGGQVDLSDVDIDTVAKYDWAYLAGNVTRYWTDEQKNKGKYAIRNMVTRKLDNLEKSMRSHLETRLFTAQSGREILSIVDFIANDPTASVSVGGLNGETNAWWRNQYKDCSARPAATYLEVDMENMWNTILNEGQDVESAPDVAVTTQTVYEIYAQLGFELTQGRIDDLKLIDLGVGNLAFKGKPIIWSNKCPAGKLFFLNFDVLNLTYDPGAWFEMTDWKEIPDQLDKAAQIAAALQLTCSDRKRLGVLFGLA